MNTPAVSMCSVLELIIWLISRNLWRTFNDGRGRKNLDILTKISWRVNAEFARSVCNIGCHQWENNIATYVKDLDLESFQ